MQKSIFSSLSFSSLQYFRNISGSSLKLLVGLLVLLSGCSLKTWPLRELQTEGCNIQTYINLRLPDYVTTRYHDDNLLRAVVVPFDVPEKFARYGHESHHFGRELARKVQQELYRYGEISIVELFNEEYWPGKRAEFFTGNHSAIAKARNAGYDFVLVGYMEEIRNAESMNVYTKLIDTSNYTTVWFGRTVVFSRERSLNKALARTGLIVEAPELFQFDERSWELASCTVGGMMNLGESPVIGVEETREGAEVPYPGDE